ncbi:MAG TPA: ParA family protein [Candidatus Polarisedimenticolia bacterium]|nr:ParA family protein [Candidatus Polarisedimenticolia bacterium]
MRTIAIANQKGGSGKTTTAINLGACLARRGRSALVVDVDPQGHASIGLSRGRPDFDGATMYDVLASAWPMEQVVRPVAPGLDLAPSNPRLSLAEHRMTLLPRGEETLREALRTLNGRYDFVLIDCPPTGGLLTTNAVRAADETIITVDAGFFALYGVSQLVELIQGLPGPGGEPARVRALATMYDARTGFAREILRDLNGYFGSALFGTVIHTNVKLKEAASYGLPIVDYAPHARGCKDYMSLAEEVAAEC